MRGTNKLITRHTGAPADDDRSRLDAQLVRQARAGSQDAFAQLYQAYLPLLFYFIRKHLRTDQDTADVVQETFVYALIRLDDLKDPAAFRSWLFRIGLSKATDAARSTARHTQDVPIDAPGFDEMTTFAPLSALAAAQAGRSSPEETQEHDEERSELLRCLHQLTPAQKDTLILRYYVGFSSVAVAQLLGLSPEAVRKRLHDAGIALRALMQSTPAAEELLAPESYKKKKANKPLDKTSQALIARLLAEDSQTSAAAGEKAAPLVTPRLSVALSALVAGGSLDAGALARTQAFLTSLNHGLPVAPTTSSSAEPGANTAPKAARSSGRFTPAGQAAMIGIALVLVYALGAGALAVWRAASKPAPTTPQTNAVATTSSQEPSQAASGTGQDATPTTSQTTTTTAATGTGSGSSAQAGTTSNPSAASGAGNNPATPSTPTPKPQPSPTQLPTISLTQSTLSYPQKADITANRLIVDSKAAAYAADGTKLTVVVSGLTNIDVNHAGNYLVFLNAQDAQGNKALPQVLHVVIRQ